MCTNDTPVLLSCFVVFVKFCICQWPLILHPLSNIEFVLKSIVNRGQLKMEDCFIQKLSLKSVRTSILHRPNNYSNILFLAQVKAVFILKRDSDNNVYMIIWLHV